MEKQQKMWSQIQLLNTLSNKFIITWLGWLDFMLYACKNTGKNKYEFVEQKVTFDNKLYSTEYSGVLGVVICHWNTNDTKITVFTTTWDIFSFSQDLIHDFLIHRDNIKIIDKDIWTLWLTLFQNKNWQLEIVDLDYSLKMRWLNFFTNAKNLNDNVKIIDVRPLNLSKESKDFFYENNISAIQAFSETKDGFHLQNIWDERAFLIVRKKWFWEMKEWILVDYFKKENNIHWMLLRYDLNNAIYKIYSIILNKEWEIIEETEIYKTNTLEHPPILHTFLLKNKKCLYFISQSTTEKQKVFLWWDKWVKELSAPNFVLLKKLEIQGKWYVWDNNYNVYILDENNYCFKKIENDRMFPLIRFAKISTKRNLSVQKCFDNLQMPMFKPPLQMNFDENMLDKIKRNEAFESCLFQEFALVNYWDKKHFISLKEMKKINNLNYKTHAESLSSINEKYPICLSVIHTYWNLLQSEIMSLKKQNKFLNLRGKKLY